MTMSRRISSFFLNSIKFSTHASLTINTKRQNMYNLKLTMIIPTTFREVIVIILLSHRKESNHFFNRRETNCAHS